MVKAKTIVLRIVVFFLVFISVVAAINYFTGENFASKNHVFVDSIPQIKVWLDANGNGKRENNEPFMPNICVWAGYDSEFEVLGGWQEICSNKYYFTNSSGAWYEFVAGVGCSEVWNAVNVPKNYFPTTPTIANGCEVEFGISQEKPMIEIKLQDAGLYLAKKLQKEKAISNMKDGLLILLISGFAGFVSFKTIRPVKAIAG